MLTRLEVDGFENLLGFHAQFGPFTCIAGPKRERQVQPLRRDPVPLAPHGPQTRRGRTACTGAGGTPRRPARPLLDGRKDARLVDLRARVARTDVAHGPVDAPREGRAPTRIERRIVLGCPAHSRPAASRRATRRITASVTFPPEACALARTPRASPAAPGELMLAGLRLVSRRAEPSAVTSEPRWSDAAPSAPSADASGASVERPVARPRPARCRRGVVAVESERSDGRR